jgi:hypothetical protein
VELTLWRISRPVVATTVVLLLLTPLLAGCGSGSSSTSDSEPLTKAEFVDQANAICRSANEERKQGTEDLEAGGQSNPSGETTEGVEALVDPIVTMTEELAELAPPKGDSARAKAIVASFLEGVAKLEAEPASFQTSSAFAKADELAPRYGLAECTI